MKKKPYDHLPHVRMPESRSPTSSGGSFPLNNTRHQKAADRSEISVISKKRVQEAVVKQRS